MGILPASDLRCRLLHVHYFVHGLLQLKPLNKLISFCKHFELLYDTQCCIPIMHLHLHLKECLLDYGPVHGFGAMVGKSTMVYLEAITLITSVLEHN